MKAEKICYKMVITNEVCRGGALNSLNKAVLVVCRSPTMFPSLYHHEIFRSYYHWLKWCSYKRSRSRSEVKVTEVKTQFSSLRTVTPIWIHIWRWNDAQRLIWHNRDALLFSKVIHHTGQKINDLDPNLAFPDCNSSLNWPMAMKWCTKIEIPYKVKQDKKKSLILTRLGVSRLTPVWIDQWLRNDAQSLK